MQENRKEEKRLRKKKNKKTVADTGYKKVDRKEKEQVSKSTIGLRVSPTMANLFGVARWTALDLGIRAQLIGQPLTQWLHAYLATHAKPLPIALSLLRSLSGSKVAELRMFRRSLKKAADRLVVCGFLKSWTINADDKFVGIRA
jgi:hypothetical protein